MKKILFILIGLFCINIASASLLDSIERAYSMANNTDYTGNSNLTLWNNGSASLAYNFSATAKQDNSSYFNNTAYYKVNKSINLSTNHTWTFSAWIKPDKCANPSAALCAIYSEMGEGGNEQFIIGINNQTIIAGTPNTTKCYLLVEFYDTAYFRLNGTTIDMCDGDWHNIIVIRNESNISLYGDGIYMNSSTCNAQCNVTDIDIQNITIGMRAYAGVQSYNYSGYIDELYFWNRSLNSSEINTLIASTEISYYPFPQSPTITNFSNVSYCFQEFANVSTDCGGLSTGRYNATGNMAEWTSNVPDGFYSSNYSGCIDGNYDINCGYVDLDISSDYGELFINYTRPILNIRGAIWQLAYLNGSPAAFVQYKNISIPDACLTNTTLNLKYQSSYDLGWGNFSCYNGSAWLKLFNFSLAYALYEEGVYWGMATAAIDNCTNFSSHFATLSAYLEDYQLILENTSVDVTISAYDTDAPLYKVNYSAAFAINQTHKICFDANITSNFSYDIYVRSTSAAGTTARFYDFNNFFNHTPENVTYGAMNYSSPSQLELLVRDKFEYDYLDNIFVRLIRYYNDENAYRVVQSDVSDTFGKVYFNIKEYNTDYKLQFLDKTGYVYLTTDSIKFVCTLTSGLCNAELLLDRSKPTRTNYSLNVSYTYNDTHVTIYVNDECYPTSFCSIQYPVNVTSEVCQLYENQTICSSNSSGTLGQGYSSRVTHVFDLTSAPFENSSNSRTYSIRVYGTASPSIWQFSDIFTILKESLAKIINYKDASLISAMVILTFGMIGLLSPVLGVTGVLYGGIVLYMLNIITIFNVGIIIAITCAGIILWAVFKY